VSRLAGVPYDPDHQCIVTAGGLSGCLIALLALLDPGDEVVLTDPTYVGMLNRVRLAGGVPVQVPFAWTGGEWRLDLDALRRAVTDRTRAVFIMSPSMPSGAVLTRSEWAAIAALCRDADLWLVYNAAMERILYDGRPHVHPAGLPGMAGRTVTIGSASKELRMIGWRVGWVVGPAELMPDIGLVSISDVVVPVGIAQPGAAAALAAPDADADVAAAVAEWQRRRDVISAELAGLPLRPAAGGWSMLLDVEALGHTGEQAAARLMERGHIAATPMVNWGVRNGPQLVRFVFANEPVARLRGIGDRVRRALA
jgi:aspartate/methionine/tyrosine aminotransferase